MANTEVTCLGISLVNGVVFLKRQGDSSAV